MFLKCLKCNFGVFVCISALIFLDLAPTKPAENRLEMRANPLEIASPCILKHTLNGWLYARFGKLPMNSVILSSDSTRISPP